LTPNDPSLSEKLKSSFETQFWYTLNRGLRLFDIGDYSKAYSFLQIGIKKLEQIVMNSSKKEKFDKKSPIILPRLRHDRFSSKAVFGYSYIVQNCPTIFFEELDEAQQHKVIHTMKFILSICNKFLQKPSPALNMMLDLVTELESGEEEPLVGSQTNIVNTLIECIGNQFLTEQMKETYKESKSRLVQNPLSKLCYGEIAILHLYSENYYESVFFMMLYSNYDSTHPVILLEIMAKLWDFFNEHLQEVLRTVFQEYIDIVHELFVAQYREADFHSAKFENVQQIAFLACYLEYKLKRKDAKFLHRLEEYAVLLKHSEYTSNNVLTYNLGLFSDSKEPLSKYFSNNYTSWIHFYLKGGDSITDEEKIGALLISLNLNFDNQMLWNLLSRFMIEKNFLKFGLQA
jgi:hypothetical protein